MFRALKSVCPWVIIHPISGCKGEIIKDEDNIPFWGEGIKKYAEGVVVIKMEMVT
jgi:hypothetical protein